MSLPLQPRGLQNLSRVTVPSILSCKSTDQRISALTAYDYTMARLLDEAGVDMLLVGDSVASVVQGLPTTLPVTLDEMIYHCRCVTRGVKRALVIGDLPFMSYQLSPEQALQSSGRLVKEGGVAAVKLEGGIPMADTIRKIVSVDIPVVGHVGLTPQSYHRMGGHKIQGKAGAGDDRLSAGTRERVMADAQAVVAAGAFALVLEGIPSDLAAEITKTIEIPTIGIGAGPSCDGQILVSYDMLGSDPTFNPSFLKKYLNLHNLVTGAVREFITDVKRQPKL